MMRQYIGARYVLKIYENSQDPLSADWESNTSYEPLTMVNYNNSSYISRKQVPASIGNPVDNPTYWALSGLYNGQIASLQNQVNELYDVKAYEMGSRNFLFLADSYDVVGDFVDTVGANIKCNSYVKRSQSGACFIRHDSPWSQYTYYNILTNLNPLSASDKEKITDVVIFASVNDSPDSDTELYNSMLQMDTWFRANLPKLTRIHLLSIGWAASQYAYQVKIDNNLRRYVINSGKLGWSYVDCTRVMRMCAWFNPSDGYHPTTTGGEKIAEACTNAILTGSCNWSGRVNDYYYTIGMPASWGTPSIVRPSGGDIRLVANCDSDGNINWWNYDNDMLINTITLPSYDVYTMTLTPTLAYKNIFPEYYKYTMTPVRNGGSGPWDVARLQQLSGNTEIMFIGGDSGGSISTGLRILGDCAPIIDPN